MKEFLDTYAKAPDDLDDQPAEAGSKEASERWHLTQLRRNRLH